MSNVLSEPPYIVDDKKSSIDSGPPPLPNDQHVVARPPIDYSSFGAFYQSTLRRFKSLWTRQFVLSLLAGQIVSLCITCTNVTTEELTTGNWQLPTTQTFFLCQGFFFSNASTLITCSPDTSPFASFIHRTQSTSVWLASFDKGGFLHHVYRWLQRLVQTDLQRWVEVYVPMISRLHWSGWLIFRIDIVLAVCDVEGNFLVVKVSSLTRTLLLFGVTNLKYHRLINIPTSSRVCSSMRESRLCRTPTFTNFLLTSPRWAIPICMFFLWVYLRMRFHWTQILVCFFQYSKDFILTDSAGGFYLCARIGPSRGGRSAHE